jgi:hypothetical protein
MIAMLLLGVIIGLNISLQSPRCNIFELCQENNKLTEIVNLCTSSLSEFTNITYDKVSTKSCEEFK